MADNTQDLTAPEAVERLIAGPLTEIARSKGMPVTKDDVDTCKLVAATFRALSAERDEMTRRRDYWKALAEGQDFTRVYLETCAERDALKAELVSTLTAAILDAQIRALENRQLDTPDQIRANALAFIDRHQKGPSQ